MKLHGDRQAFSANLAARCATFAAGAFYMAANLSSLAALPGLAGLGTIAAFTTMSVVSTPAMAQVKTYRDDTPEADHALSSSEWSNAIADLDKRIASNPRDVQARFKRATALAHLGRDNEAIKALVDITQTYPELPEPYNNLAALYAKHGNYQQARATLETALAANPNFALARRNLGDVYLHLAADEYARAAKDNAADHVAPARSKAIRAMLAASPAAGPNAYAKAAPVTLPPRRSTAEAVNARGFVPSMGAQPPTILPDQDTTNNNANMN